MTMLPSIYFPENTPDVDAIYENELVNRFYYWPLIFSQSATPLSPSGLSSADSSVYYTYSGVDWKYTTVARQKDGRYRNITVKTVSGDSFYFYLQTSLTPDQTTYHAGPVTASGSYYTLTKYTTISGAEANPVEFTSVMGCSPCRIQNKPAQ